MDDGLLSLRWNNHKTTFFHVLSSLRKKGVHTDVTLACENHFYSAHKLVLTTCSDYFNEVFDRTSCKSPVIILKDVSHKDLESLLDYMYLGEVEVKQSQLGSLIKAAECLKIKGLAVSDEETTSNETSKEEVLPENQSVDSSLDGDSKLTSVNKEAKQSQLILPDIIKLEEEEASIDRDTFFEKTDTFMDSANASIGNMSETFQKYDVGSAGSSEPQDDTSWLGQVQYLHQNLNGASGVADSILPYKSTRKHLKASNKFKNVDLSCTYCSYKAPTPYKLRRHLMIHTGEKPYSCLLCSYKCNRKENLVYHQASVHPC